MPLAHDIKFGGSKRKKSFIIFRKNAPAAEKLTAAKPATTVKLIGIKIIENV